MIVIQYKETLEQQYRREYNLPSSVLPYDMDPEGFWKAVGKVMADRVMEQVKLNLNIR